MATRILYGIAFVFVGAILLPAQAFFLTLQFFVLLVKTAIEVLVKGIFLIPDGINTVCQILVQGIELFLLEMEDRINAPRE